MGITRGLSFVLQFRLLRTEGVVSFCWGSGLVCSLTGTLAASNPRFTSQAQPILVFPDYPIPVPASNNSNYYFPDLAAAA